MHCFFEIFLSILFLKNGHFRTNGKIIWKMEKKNNDQGDII